MKCKASLSLGTGSNDSRRFCIRMRRTDYFGYKANAANADSIFKSAEFRPIQKFNRPYNSLFR